MIIQGASATNGEHIIGSNTKRQTWKEPSGYVSVFGINLFVAIGVFECGRTQKSQEGEQDRENN